MATPVHIPTPLRSFCDGASTVSIDGPTVGEALSALIARYPRLRRHLYADNGELRGYVNVFVNETDLRALEAGGATPLAAGDTITILPSIAGG